MPPRLRPGLSGVRPWVLLAVVTVVVLSAVLAYEATARRSIASWFAGANYWDQLTLNQAHPANLNATAEGEKVLLQPEDGTEELDRGGGGSAADDTGEDGPEADIDAAEAEAADEADAEGGSSEADKLRHWKLMHSMMYWAHSHPVPKPTGGALFPAAAEPQYITWEQDFAGMNNVRLQVEVLVIMAHLFRRTLVMPDHLSDAMDHLGDQGQHRISDFFDFEDLSTWVPIMSMQEYLDAREVPEADPRRTDMEALRAYLRDPGRHDGTVYPKWDANSEVMPVPDEEGVQQRRDPSWEDFAARSDQHVYYGEDYQQARTMHFMMEGEDYRLFGNMAGFWFFPSQGWQDYYYAGLRDHFHYHRDILANASRVVHFLHDRFGGPFNALHDRTDDFRDQFPDFYIDEAQLRDNVMKVLGDSELPLYIATKTVNASRYAPLLTAYPGEPIFLPDVLEHVLPGIPAIFLGTLEQAICSVAHRFVGTFGSTFTGYIHRLRGHHQPGLVPDKGVFYANYPMDPEQYDDSVENNEPWATIRFWRVPEGEMQYDNAMWAREFSTTWDFPQSEKQRRSSVFEPVRRRQRRRRQH